MRASDRVSELLGVERKKLLPALPGFEAGQRRASPSQADDFPAPPHPLPLDAAYCSEQSGDDKQRRYVTAQARAAPELQVSPAERQEMKRKGRVRAS